MKVLAACGSGMGSSQIIKMKLTTCSEIEYSFRSSPLCAVSEAKSSAKTMI